MLISIFSFDIFIVVTPFNKFGFEFLKIIGIRR